MNAAWLRFWSTAYTQHLEEEIAWLRTQAQQAQQRYEIAVAELVRLKTEDRANVYPRPLMAEKEPDLGREVERLQKNPEWAEVGT